MSKASIKRTMDALTMVVGELDKINGLPLNYNNRLKTKETVDLAVSIGFTKNVDKENCKIKLFWGNGPLSEVVEIGATATEIWVGTDRLWGTICGYNEQIQEMECYEREMKNW